MLEPTRKQDYTRLLHTTSRCRRAETHEVCHAWSIDWLTLVFSWLLVETCENLSTLKKSARVYKDVPWKNADNAWSMLGPFQQFHSRFLQVSKSRSRYPEDAVDAYGACRPRYGPHRKGKKRDQNWSAMQCSTFFDQHARMGQYLSVTMHAGVYCSPDASCPA